MIQTRKNRVLIYMNIVQSSQCRSMCSNMLLVVKWFDGFYCRFLYSDSICSLNIVFLI